MATIAHKRIDTASAGKRIGEFAAVETIPVCATIEGDAARCGIGRKHILPGTALDAATKDFAAQRDDIAEGVAGNFDPPCGVNIQIFDVFGQHVGGESSIDPVIAATSGFGHRIADVVDIIRIVPRTAVHVVGAGAAIERVRTIAPVERVVARTAVDRVRFEAAGRVIVAIAQVEDDGAQIAANTVGIVAEDVAFEIGEGIAFGITTRNRAHFEVEYDPGVAVFPADGVEAYAAVHFIGTATGVDRVVTVAAVDGIPDHIAAVDGIVVETAFDIVDHAIAAVDRIVACCPVQALRRHGHHVVEIKAGDGVVAIAPIQVCISGIDQRCAVRSDDVVAFAPIHDDAGIVFERDPDPVSRSIAGERVGTGVVIDQVFDIFGHRPAGRARIDDELATRIFGFLDGVQRGIDVICVVAGPADHPVVARAAIDDVACARTVNGVVALAAVEVGSGSESGGIERIVAAIAI